MVNTKRHWICIDVRPIGIADVPAAVYDLKTIFIFVRRGFIIQCHFISVIGTKGIRNRRAVITCPKLTIILIVIAACQTGIDHDTIDKNGQRTAVPTITPAIHHHHIIAVDCLIGGTAGFNRGRILISVTIPIGVHIVVEQGQAFITASIAIIVDTITNLQGTIPCQRLTVITIICVVNITRRLNAVVDRHTV